jgi:uncharacterized protein
MPRIAVFFLALLAFAGLHAQSIGHFQSVEPMGQTDVFDIPPTHRYQLIIQSGDSLTSGELMPYSSDFTGYVPIAGSSTNGHLSVNSEGTPGGVTVLDVQYNATSELWEVTSSGRSDLSALGDSLLFPTVRNCSGGLTPWGTVITCEEQETITDLDSNGYYDFGWSIETDPVSRTAVDQDGDSIPDKLWAFGHFRHENAACADDSITIYQGEDNFTYGFLFKFIADQKAKLGSGKLYVLRRTGNGGQWLRVPNASQWDRNRTSFMADSMGATRFLRIEDVEIGPEGKVYFTSTTMGRIYRFRDLGPTITHFETFVENAYFPIQHRLGTTLARFETPDNLAFDGEGNLWVLQDGGGNFIWVVGRNHSSANPDIRIFGNSVRGTEPTGITFTPDYRFLFMSLQHPFATNVVPCMDAAGNTIVFNRDATLVIARSEDLGSPFVLENPQPIDLDVQISPNPAQSELKIHIKTSQAGLSEIKIIELLGRVTLLTQRQLQFGDNVIPLDLTALPAGNYAVLVTTAEGQVVKTLTKL